MTLRKTFFGRKLRTAWRRPKGAVACLCFLLFALAAQAGTAARAETMNVRLTLLPGTPARLRVEGERTGRTRTWSFRNAYAGMVNLGERVENLSLADEAGASVAARKLGPGVYEAAADATRFSYEVRLSPPAFESDAAHVSWLAEAHGLLMTADLLPLAADAGWRATLSIKLPDGWAISNGAEAGAGGKFDVESVESAVFLVGRNLRVTRRKVGAGAFVFVTTGDWAFSDGEVAGLAESILEDHAMTFRGFAQGDAVLMLAPFPRAAAAGNWSAETRGNRTVLLSGKSPSKTAALAQLSFPLAHELLHLWVPNGLKLEGQYDWFYEGFTLYQALRAGVRLNLLTFQDYLDAMGRAFDGYKAARGRDEVSLLEASSRRWAGSPLLVYNKGMLVAFLYDLTLRLKTKGKLSLDDVYRELFSLYRAGAAGSDGNRAVLAALNAQGAMEDFTRRYVEGPAQIDLPEAIAPFGLQVDAGGARTHVSVSDGAGGAQRDLLRKFGYNEKTYGVTRHGRAGR